MEFLCSDPQALVRAANVRATLDAFKLVPSIGRRLVERHRLNVSDLRPDNFIPVQRWLDALKDIQQEVGPTVVRSVGTHIVENADIPPTFETPEQMLLAIDDLYQMNHRGDVGRYVVSRKNDGLEVRCETPYPRMFEWGLIEGFAHNKRLKGAHRYKVDYAEAPPGGRLTCTLFVRKT